MFCSAAETVTRAQRSVFLLINASYQLNGGLLASKVTKNLAINRSHGWKICLAQAALHVKRAQYIVPIKKG